VTSAASLPRLIVRQIVVIDQKFKSHNFFWFEMEKFFRVASICAASETFFRASTCSSVLTASTALTALAACGSLATFSLTLSISGDLTLPAIAMSFSLCHSMIFCFAIIRQIVVIDQSLFVWKTTQFYPPVSF
jgi:hypothetical protein